MSVSWYLQRAVEDPEAMDFVVQQGVVDSSDKRAFVLQPAGWPVISWAGQTGPLQSAVQIPQRVRLHPTLPSVAWNKEESFYMTVKCTPGWNQHTLTKLFHKSNFLSPLHHITVWAASLCPHIYISWLFATWAAWNQREMAELELKRPAKGFNNAAN